MSRRSRKRKKVQQSQPPPVASPESGSQSQPDDSWTLARARNVKVSIELLVAIFAPIVVVVGYFAVPAIKALFREQLRQELQHIEHEERRADRSVE